MSRTKEAQGDRRRMSTARLGLALFASLAAVAPARAMLASADAAVGQWDLSLEESDRQCRVTLRSDASGAGRAVGMPAGCRRALPILADVASWSVPTQDHLDLANASGTPVLDFIFAGADGFLAQGPQGEIYRFVAVKAPKQSTVLISPEKPAAPGPEPVKVAAATPTKATPGPAVKLNDIPGRYSILREGGKDTGCMLTLGGANRAILAPACRDQGLVIFDPSSWQIVGGRLVLTARKGHKAHLDLQQDGTWTKDPQEGKGLILKKQ